MTDTSIDAAQPSIVERLGIEPFDIAIEAVDELFVSDGFRRREQPGGRDDRAPGQGLVVTHAG